MKEYFGDKKEWISVTVGIIISILSLFILKKFKIPMYILGIAVFIFVIIFWRMWAIIDDLKKGANEPVKLEKFVYSNDSLFLLLLDKYNFLTNNSYITLSFEDEGILNYVGTAYVTGNAAEKYRKQALLLHTTISENELKKNTEINKFHVSLAMQMEYINYIRKEQ